MEYFLELNKVFIFCLVSKVHRKALDFTEALLLHVFPTGALK